jgi:hypothetical protein
MPDPDALPLLFLPRNLSPVAAAHFIDALHQLIAAMESHYGEQQLRSDYRQGIAQRDLDSKPAPTDPPFSSRP